jgi:hypothetical protein
MGSIVPYVKRVVVHSKTPQNSLKRNVSRWGVHFSAE